MSESESEEAMTDSWSLTNRAAFWNHSYSLKEAFSIKFSPSWSEWGLWMCVTTRRASAEVQCWKMSTGENMTESKPLWEMFPPKKRLHTHTHTHTHTRSIHRVIMYADPSPLQVPCVFWFDSFLTDEGYRQKMQICISLKTQQATHVNTVVHRSSRQSPEMHTDSSGPAGWCLKNVW